MQYKLLASDFDNTLVPFGEPCPRPAVVKAVKKMQAAGGKFVLSTGRGYCVINKQQLGGIRFDYAITNNGACVVDRDGAIIAEHPMTNEEMYALVDFCEDYNYPLQFNFRDGYYAYCEYESLRDFYAQLSGSGLTCKDGEDQDRHLIDMPHAAFACLPDEALEAFSRKYGHLNLRFMMVGAVREGSWHCYDIVREGIDKGVGLADLCETVGLTLADAVSAGDSANDVGMLKAAGLGCCMANGSDDAKEAADRIIGDVREDGLADLIETSGLLRRQKKALLELAESRGLPKDTLTALAERLLATEEARNARTTSVTDMIAKLGPMFGLLGTLIPLGPGIVALGQGDTVTLSESMNVAFDTTIAGVISAAVASVISHIRKRWYNDDMVSLETLMEAVLEEVTSDVEG